MRRAMLRKSSYGGGIIPPIASYPLYTNSNEIIGTTAGIDGVDTAIVYDGTKATFNGLTSKIAIPDNSIFSFTDGVNDLPFSLEVTFTYNSGFLVIASKRLSDAIGEYEIRLTTNTIIFMLLSNTGNIYFYIYNAIAIGVESTLKVVYDGNKGCRMFLNNVELTIITNDSGYSKMTASASNKLTFVSRNYYNSNKNGTMKNLKFYNYEKL